MDASAPTSRFRTLIVATVVIGTAALVAATWILGNDRSRAGEATMVDDASAPLGIKPRTIELTSEKAARVRAAIKQDDFSTARRIAGEVMANSIVASWRYHPFDIFITGIPDVVDPAFAERLNAWVAQDERDEIPLLIRAQYYHDIAWVKRGHRFANQVEADAMASFENYMKDAFADADAAIHLNDRNPFGFYLKLRILRGFGASQAMDDALEQAIAKHPDYYPFYQLALHALEPKWGGTVARMYAFVDKHTGHAGADSPLRLLYLDLYADLLNTASFDCMAYRKDRDQWAQCVAPRMKEIVTPALEKQVLAALQLYDHTDKYEFGLAVEGIISYMLGTGGADVYSGAILQLAATSMHSDTQLVRREPGRNDYVIDKLVAKSWYAKGFYDNAVTKYQDALKTIDATAFPSEEEKDLAVAAIHEDIARVHNQLHQYADMITSEKIAVATGNLTQVEYFICYGLYKLKKHADAVRACGKAIEHQPGNLYAYYWRGVALRDSGRPDDALRDLAIVAGSEHDFRANAAIDMSMIYFNRNDIQSALNVLNRYTYLYDTATTSNSSVAVSYNNRCYAYMQLGELEKALDDCTASLRYGSLPDAYRKQQELVKRLGLG
jgi:tetratricopeptide (TPR) repeat protein